ncbi:MAG: nitroreductase family protein [Candidatus Roizmanbacteria bacterium]|nr:nitroreductase family protein [Candidatus Roizmanbacteria bacterium]
MLKTNRTSTYPINQIILHRWSPRAMTGEPIDDATLISFFDAARWAPSSMNNQLTRFVYAKRDTEHFKKFMNVLVEFNQKWCANAAALVMIISRKKSYHKDLPHPSHSLESGACMQNLMLEATSRGYVVHGMTGFDFETSHALLGLSDNWQVDVMLAIGVFDKAKSEEMKEEVSDRKPLSELVFEGVLPEDFE